MLVSLNDWLDLFGVGEIYRSCVSGRASLEDCKRSVEEAKDAYHQTSQDSVAILTQLMTQFSSLEEIAQQQEAEVEQFNQVAGELGLFFPYVSGKLLSEDELSWFGSLQEELQRRFMQVEQELQNQEREAEQLAREIEEESRLLEEELEDLEAKVEEAAEELEDALRAMEDENGKMGSR